MARRPKTTPLTAQDLSRWKLVADFQERLVAQAGAPEGTFADDRRRLGEEQYFGLMLFGLLNPVVESMRGLCAASRLQRVQEEICDRPVSLGSFSETQAVKIQSPGREACRGGDHPRQAL